MIEAQLKHRGEHFEVSIHGQMYEGQCNWSWEGEKDNPKRTYPVAIEADSISRVGLKKLIRLSKEKRIEVARIAAKELNQSDSGRYLAYYKGEKL